MPLKEMRLIRLKEIGKNMRRINMTERKGKRDREIETEKTERGMRN